MFLVFLAAKVRKNESKTKEKPIFLSFTECKDHFYKNIKKYVVNNNVLIECKAVERLGTEQRQQL